MNMNRIEVRANGYNYPQDSFISFHSFISFIKYQITACNTPLKTRSPEVNFLGENEKK